MQLLAKDGVYISDFPREIATAPIPAAGRADVMVRCPTADTYTVSDWDGTLLHLDVGGDAVTPGELPDSWTFTLPDYLTSLINEPVKNECSCSTSFQVNCAQNENGQNVNCVNNNPFDASRYIHTVVLGEVVERELNNLNAHPYHQHVYPFQIIDGVGGLTDANDTAYFQQGDWHDVLMIDSLPPRQGGGGGGVTAVTTRYRATQHLGKIMLHVS